MKKEKLLDMIYDKLLNNEPIKENQEIFDVNNIGRCSISYSDNIMYFTYKSHKYQLILIDCEEV
jgi:hypothetical protein